MTSPPPYSLLISIARYKNEIVIRRCGSYYRHNSYTESNNKNIIIIIIMITNNYRYSSHTYNIRCIYDTLYGHTAETRICTIYCIMHNLENSEIRSVLNPII